MRAIALDHVVLEVQDVDRALRFYRDLLGLSPVRLEEYRRGQAPFVSLRVGPLLIDLFPVPTPHACPHHLCLELDAPMADVLDALRRFGLAPETPRQRFGARGLGWSIYVEDPDHHRIELRTYRPDAR